jgi:two-component system, OmpR family, response regulator
MVVDDDVDIRRIAALSLEHLGGFRVTLASSATEAVAQATRAPPDLILLDVSMPGMDGPSALAALRAHPGTHDVPVVFFTALSNDAEIARLRALGTDLGVVGFVFKPFDVAALPARVRDMLSLAGLDGPAGSAAR